MSDAFRIQIEEQGEGVSAEVLRLQLDQALRFLREDGQSTEDVDWRVTQANMNSPLVLELERYVPPGHPEPASRPGEQLARAFARLQRGEDLGEELSITRLHAIEKMASQANDVRTIRVSAGKARPIDLNPDWAQRVRRIRVQRTRHAAIPEQLYSITGRLEGVNVHGNKSEFYLYDPLTDQKMRCIFPDEMLDKVGQALGGRVEVSGLTTFGPEHQPQVMHVDSLRRIATRSGSFLDRLAAAHRRGPISLTGDLTIEEAIDEVRGAAN